MQDVVMNDDLIEATLIYAGRGILGGKVAYRYFEPDNLTDPMYWSKPLLPSVAVGTIIAVHGGTADGRLHSVARRGENQPVVAGFFRGDDAELRRWQSQDAANAQILATEARARTAARDASLEQDLAPLRARFATLNAQQRAALMSYVSAYLLRG